MKMIILLPSLLLCLTSSLFSMENRSDNTFSATISYDYQSGNIQIVDQNNNKVDFLPGMSISFDNGTFTLADGNNTTSVTGDRVSVQRDSNGHLTCNALGNEGSTRTFLHTRGSGNNITVNTHSSNGFDLKKELNKINTQYALLKNKHPQAVTYSWYGIYTFGAFFVIKKLWEWRSQQN